MCLVELINCIDFFTFQKNYDEQKMNTREVKSLADSIICNAETNGYVPIKRSFVEEVSDRMINSRKLCHFWDEGISYDNKVNRG